MGTADSKCVNPAACIVVIVYGFQKSLHVYVGVAYSSHSQTCMGTSCLEGWLKLELLGWPLTF